MPATTVAAWRKTTYAALTDLLREEIISGTLPAGSRTTIAEVASRYGVSQMPVREALQCLQGEGLLVLSPHKGARLLSLDAQLVNNIYDVRGAVESLLARLSLPHLSNAVMGELEEFRQGIDAAARNEDAMLVLTLNGDGHHLLYQYAGNPPAFEIYERYRGLMGALRRTYGVGPGRSAEMAAGFAELLAALRGQDADKVGQLVSRQCELAKRDLLQLMSQAHGAATAEGADPTTTRLLESAARK